ncbi:MAG: Ribosome-releasing factor 2, mitochondrial [Icmadophila ericetorum]|nr:Ribosome-releasing factor 2, mitochondrial [Icmadophila ericetorum]
MPLTLLDYYVDDGSTVTDFLPAERARGITIQSAAITFNWPPLPEGATASAELNISDVRQSHAINLIDTPGHADFTFEVLRSLRILDGAVCILDGVAGVEAQTEKVWYQAANYQIPKIIYVNKLDRDGAAFGSTVREIASKLHVWPAVCQIPWLEEGSGRFLGVVDVVSLRGLLWTGGDGKSIKVMDLVELKSAAPALEKEVRKAREALVELLGEYDTLMVESYLKHDEDHMAIPPEEITQSLRRCFLGGEAKIAPVFAGASFRNIGVQPLLDAVVDLLPNPSECPDPQISLDNDKLHGGLKKLLNGKFFEQIASKAVKKKGKRPTAAIKNIEALALAFKVVNDPRRGVLVYVRVYHGSINRNALLFNTDSEVSERVPKLLRMYASDAVEVDSIPCNQIGVITGLKYARTGDTLIAYLGADPQRGPPAPLDSLQLRPIEVPPPVFFVGIEPQSLGEEKPVLEALSLLLREDPSLQLSVDEDSGQTLLSGMGELHLEIAADRLINDFKAKARIGRIEIGYRECVTVAAGPEIMFFDKETAGKKGKAGCMASAGPLTEKSIDTAFEGSPNYVTYHDGNKITVQILDYNFSDFSDEDAKNPFPKHLSPRMVYESLRNGALAALTRGPLHSFPLHSTWVSILINPATHVFGAETTISALSSAARLAARMALKKSAEKSPSVLMEPVMNAIISVDENSLGAVVHDISSSRGGHIISLDDADVISAASPGDSREDLKLIDLKRVYAPPDPFMTASVEGGKAQQNNIQRHITAKVPLREMVGYLKHLRGLTGGRGTFVMSVDQFEKMGAQREKAVLQELKGV